MGPNDFFLWKFNPTFVWVTTNTKYLTKTLSSPDLSFFWYFYNDELFPKVKNRHKLHNLEFERILIFYSISNNSKDSKKLDLKRDENDTMRVWIPFDVFSVLTPLSSLLSS